MVVECTLLRDTERYRPAQRAFEIPRESTRNGEWRVEARTFRSKHVRARFSGAPTFFSDELQGAFQLASHGGM